MTTPSLSRVRDILVELDATDLSLQRRRELVSELAAFLAKREGHYALEQLLQQVNDEVARIGPHTLELREWRPTILRVLQAEAERIELEAVERKEGRRFTTWLMGAIDAKTVLIVLAIIGGVLGLSVTLPGGIVVGTPPAATPEAP